jgi:hypothetical protein
MIPHIPWPPSNPREPDGLTRGNPGGELPIFHGVVCHRPTNTDPASSPAALLTGRYANIPVAVAVGLLLITPVFGSSPLWPSLAGAILAAALALPVWCR